MRKPLIFIILFLMPFHSILFAKNSILERFFPNNNNNNILSKMAPIFKLPKLPKVNTTKPSIEDFNAGVDFNNSGLEDMRAGRHTDAKRKFAKACKLAPSEKGFWSNYLIALNKFASRKKQAIKAARIILALDRSDFQAAYLAGIIYLNDFDNPKKALQYFTLAHELNPDNANLAMAMASAYEKAGYSEDSFRLLKQYAHLVKDDAYPFYKLGLEYLKRENYNAAIRALKSAKKNDNEGYAYDAYIRTKYYAGQLNGLRAECKETLRRFPRILNKKSVERILFSISPQDFKFVETITLNLNQPKSIDKLAFLVKIPPSIPNHQQVRLIEALVISQNQSKKIEPSSTELDGRLRFSVSSDLIASEFRLKLTYRIKTSAWLGSNSKEYTNDKPDLRELQKDPHFSLSHPMVSILSDKINRQSGNYVQNVVKAVVSGLKYKENCKDQEVAWIFSNLNICDCTEFARLTTALCLKKNIPARVTTGFLVKQELLNKESSIGHAWCEVFMPNKGWFPIDPTLQSTMKWAYFGNLLSDQIIFGYMSANNKPRVSIDFISTSSGAGAKISGSYNISIWNNY